MKRDYVKLILRGAMALLLTVSGFLDMINGNHTTPLIKFGVALLLTTGD